MDWKKFFYTSKKPKSMETVVKQIQKKVMSDGSFKIPTKNYANWLKSFSKLFKK